MKIQVCTGKKCKQRWSEYILERLKNDKEFYKLNSLIIEECGCKNNCKNWPIVIVDGKEETHMNGVKASKILLDKMKWKGKKEKGKRNFHHEESSWNDLENIYLGK